MPPDERSRREPAPYAWYVVAVLMVLNVSSFIDRQVMALLVTPIKADLGLTDSEVSLLLGPAFAAMFAISAIFIGRLVDRRSRRAIVAWGVAFWSVACAATGVANTFGQVFAARVGVGVGEATLSPSAYSLIADYVPPHRLATAMSLFTSGVFIGSGLAYFIGGVLIDSVQQSGPWTVPLFGEIRSWQKVFIIVGLPGFALALLALTIREPRRLHRQAADAPWTLAQVRAWFRRHATAYATLGLGIALFSMVNYGTAFWFPAYFERAHGWSSGKIGLLMGGATAIFGLAGVLAGGQLADWLRTRGRRDGNLIVLILAAAVSVLAAWPLFLPPTEPVMLAALLVTNIVAAAPFGAAAAAVQEMSPPPMRGQASALLVFMLNFVGLGLGPPVVALMTDHVFRDPAKVGLSLLVATVLLRGVAALAVAGGLAAHRRAVAEVTP
ncbi:MAG: MFS transporter [Gemmatimonadaceae bacterium]|nr:MFS transporter [Gemmatimonadaceae bacterium]